MTFKAQKFAGTNKSEFLPVLRQRVNQYFKERDRSKYANRMMVFKTVVMFALFFVPYSLMAFSVVSHPLAIIAMWTTMGVGMAGIGLSIMHDANHGSYSTNKYVNKLLGLSLNLVGGNADVWKIQHNMLHHTYTNIHGADDDINTPPFLRFSPYTERRSIHRFQHLYVWFFYGLATLSWVTTKEFAQIARYKKQGLIQPGKAYNKFFLQIVLWKLVYYSYVLVIPLLFFQSPAWLTVLSFFVMHFCAGFILTTVFQTAHIMPECDYRIVEEDGVIDENWAVHEMLTTANYAPNSRVFSWYIGGLNYQIEHHLFPTICHVHYRQLAKIVVDTANEFDIPYNTHKSFFHAVWSHGKMLHSLGRSATLTA